MKRFLQVLICVLLLLTTLSCVACNKITKTTTTTDSEVIDSSGTSTDSGSEDEDEDESEVTSYTVTFVTDENVSVYVYNTQSMSSDGTLATSAVARDGSTGLKLVDGNGQVNFRLVFEDGYTLDSISADKNYNALKPLSNTKYTDCYRITKIKGDVTVTISSKEDVQSYSATFDYDTTIEDLDILVYDSLDFTSTYTVYSADSSLEVLSTDNEVNFIVSVPNGYKVSKVSATKGKYTSILQPKTLGVDNAYSITGISGDIVIKITVSEVALETGFVISIDDTEYDTTATLTTTYGSDWQSEITGYATYQNGTTSEIDLEFSSNPTEAGVYDIDISYGTYSDISLTLTINKKEIVAPTNTFDTLLYTGNELTFYPENYDECLMEIEGNVGTNSGTYLATVTLLDTQNYCWDDETIESKEYTWYINSNITFDIPSANTNVFTYNGSDQTYIPVGFDSTYMSISDNVQKEVGTYIVTVSLLDKINYSWSDSTTTDITYTFKIEKTKLSKVTENEYEYVYTGSTVTYVPNNFDDTLMSISGNTGINVGTYTATISLLDTTNYTWEDGTVEDIDISWEINKATLTIPVATNVNLTYTGSTVTFTPNYLDLDTMTITGNTGVDSGSYTATISIIDTTNYSWTDGTIIDKTIEWNILEVSLNYNITVMDTETITVSHDEDDEDYFAVITFPEGTTYSINQDTGLLTLTYSDVSEDDLEFTITGTFYGALLFNLNEEDDGELALKGLTLTSTIDCPINIESANNFDISIKESFTNYIYDEREAQDDLQAAIYSVCDLKLKGNGTLIIESENNNGIHTKDDLTIKNLTLSVNCEDNALKGNDSVTIESGTLTLIARVGDGIKTSNTGLYSSDSSQQGTIEILDGTVTIYAACDGIDAAYNVEISGGSVTIYTDKYSSYSEEVTTVTSGTYYIKSSTTSYKYSIYYYNSSSDYKWVNSSSYTTARSNSGTTYYYYEMDKPSGYSYLKVYVYTSSQTQGQSSSYKKCSSVLSINDNYDTISYSNSSFTWTTYSTSSQSSGMGGPGGQQGGGQQQEEGNTDKGDYSTKGIKADNEILISGGTIFVKSYDDAIHTNSDATLESGATPTGNIVISGGTLTLYSNDDGIHADGTVTISGDDTVISITNSYEGIEGTVVNFNGGNVKVVSSDDGVNATKETGESIVITDGYLYIYAGGDGLDSNSTSSYDAMLIAGGHTVVISYGNSDSSLDTENGYKYTGGYVVAIGPTGGMNSSESVKASNFSSIGYSTSVSATQNYYLTVSNIVSVKMPRTMSAFVVVLSGSSSASVSTSSSSSLTFDGNVSWIA